MRKSLSVRMRAVRVLAVRVQAVRAQAVSVLAVLLMLVVWVAGTGAAFARQDDSVQVTAVRFAGAGEVTRVVLESDRQINARVLSRIDPDGKAALVIDLPLAVWSVDGQLRSGGAGEGYGLVSGYRYGASGPLASRLVLDLAQPVEVMREIALPPGGDAQTWRLTLDLIPLAADEFNRRAMRDARRLVGPAGLPGESSALPAPAAVTTTPEAPVPTSPSRKLALATPDPSALSAAEAAASAIAGTGPAAGMAGPPRRYVIVIDPGHGGRDPGAIASTGLREKDVNLNAALQIKAILERNPRFEVKLTRDTDVFVELEDRVTLARNWGANLFISVHADSADSSAAAGASVYTLSERGARRSELAQSANNWTVPLGPEELPDDVKDILEDLTVRETQTKSSEFAEMLILELADAGPLIRNTHRNAGFVVLFAPDVPAVLLELGFLTNAADVRRLSTVSGREKAAEAVARAIETYFDTQERLLADR